MNLIKSPQDFHFYFLFPFPFNFYFHIVAQTNHDDRAANNNKDNFQKLKKIFGESEKQEIERKNSNSKKSEISLRNEKYKIEKEERKKYLKENRRNFSIENSKLNRISSELIEKINLNIENRLHARSRFLQQRCILSEECRLGLMKIVEAYLLTLELGFCVEDITFRRKNLSEEVRFIQFYFM